MEIVINLKKKKNDELNSVNLEKKVRSTDRNIKIY